MTERSDLRALAPCPDPATIAAHVDRRLTAEEAARLDEHVAGCADCYEVFSETVQFALAEGEAAGLSRAGVASPGGRPRPRVLVWTGLAAAAVVVLAAAAWLYRSRPGPGGGSPVTELAEAMRGQRFVEARVTGGFRHGRLVRLRSGDGPQGLDAQPPAVLAAVARIRERAAADTSPEALGALGVTYLVSGDATAAVKALESAVAQRPDDARLLSDLSAAYLARAAQADEPADVPQALEAAERAIGRPNPPVEAYFNRAVALERLHLVGAARKAWDDYLQRDTSSGWADEARQRRDALPNERRSSVEEDRARVKAATEHGVPAVQALAREAPALLHDYLTNVLLPAWADAHLLGRDDAARHAEHLRVLAEAVTAATRDALDADTARALVDPDASATAADAIRAQALGFKALGAAQRRYERGEPSCAAFREASRDLQAGGSPYVAWARQQVVTACLLVSDPAAARAELTRLLALAEGRSYTQLRGRVQWLQALIHVNRGELAHGLRAYREAEQRFRAVGDGESEAATVVRQTEILQVLGEWRAAWRERTGVLASLDRVRIPVRRQGMLAEATWACLDGGLPRTGLHFGTALVQGAYATALPLAISDALVIRARLHHALEEDERARADIEEARGAVARIPDRETAAEQEAEADALTGGILLRDDPDAALAPLREALTHFRRVAPGRTPELHLLLGRAHAARGSKAEAEAQLGAGIEAMERGRHGIADASFKVTFFEQARPLFDEMVRLQAGPRGDPDRALAFVERGRARQLADVLAGATVAPLDPNALRSALPAGLTLLYYTSLDDRLYGWAVSRDGVRFMERPLPAAELSRLVASYQVAIHRRAPDGVLHPASARLHDELVRPFIPFIAAQRALVFIPDGVLQSVPFAALRNGETGRYLVEDHVVGVAPSGTVFARASEAAGRLGGRLGRALAIGNPGFDSGLWRGLSALPAAAAEAAEIASLYAGADLLSGREATKQAFLDRLAESEVVHYAGHALSSEAMPAAARLLFAPDRRLGDPGALYLHELARTRLARTRVVVLAACRTGAGAVSRVEGALGLGRPFLAAGVPDVVTSLWDIDDASSRRFFVSFHRALLRQGDPVVALREAQIAQLRSGDVELSHPASWAAFMCMGGLDPHSLSKGEAS